MSNTDDSPPSPVHPSCIDPDQLLADCDVRRSRASGPGGQHRNKVETAVEITHRPTGITAAAGERRSQDENRKVAVRRLRTLLAVKHRTVTSAAVEPSPLWQSRCQKGKIQCNDRHVDFPAILSEAMNAVHAKDYDVKVAAAALGCSTSQLIRFLAKVPDALQHVNNERAGKGLNRLRT